jgi:SAM-dependent methyltransferase
MLKCCSGCGLVYLENPPEYSSLRDEMAWEKTFAAESQARRRRSPMLYRLSRMPKAALQRMFKRDKLLSWVRRYFSPGAVLDVGCAGGHMLERLPAEFIPHGIEISDELAAAAEQRFRPRGGRVVRADALCGLRQFDAGLFTGVIMTGFLEHESDPRAVLAGARRVLHPGAKLIVKVPNYGCWNRTIRGKRWCGFRFPEHVNYFTPALLARLLTESGFRVLRFGIFDRFPTSDSMWLLAGNRAAALL